MNFFSKDGFLKCSYYIAVTMPLLLILYATLFLDNLDYKGIDLSYVYLTISKTVLFSTVTVCLSILVAIPLGFAMTNVLNRSSRKALVHACFSILVIPFLLGTTSTAYIGKLFFADTAILSWAFQNGWMAQHFLTFLIKFWQYCPFAAYLFFLSYSENNDREIGYIIGNKIPKLNELLHFYLPKIEGTFIVLVFLLFLFSFYEFTTSFLLIKPSTALGTELVSHMISRLNRLSFISNPENARESIIAIGVGVFLICSICAILVVILLGAILKKISLLKNNINYKGSFSQGVIYSFILITLLPIALALNETIKNIDIESLVSLVKATAITIPIACFLSLSGGIFASFTRSLWGGYTAKVNVKFSLFICLSIISLAIPPIVLVISIFSLKGTFYSSESYFLMWSATMIVKYLPIIIIFYIATFISVKTNELEFVKFYKVGGVRKFEVLFFGRYLSVYLLTTLIAYSLVINDATINSLFSDFVQSLPGLLDKAISGRAANNGIAASLLFVSFFISLMIIITWLFSLNKLKKK